MSSSSAANYVLEYGPRRARGRMTRAGTAASRARGRAGTGNPPPPPPAFRNRSQTQRRGRETAVDRQVGLLQIIISYLAHPALDIPTEERQGMVSCLLNVTVQETDEPITVGYSVSLSSGEVVEVKDCRMIRWERENSKLYMQSSDGESSYEEKIKFATYFADEISKGVLFEMADQIPSLAELIKFGSLLDFQDAAVGFLLRSKNLQLFPEDDYFLKSSMLGGSKNK